MSNSASSPVLGFTEAELGIVLALLAAAVVAFGVVPTAPEEPERAAITADSLTALEAGMALLSAENARQADSLVLQAELIRTQRDSLDILKSNIWPNCQPPTPIMTLDVLGANSYRLGGVEVNSADIGERTDEARIAANKQECRLIVGVRMAIGLEARDYQRALDRLGALGLRTRALGDAPL